MVHQNIKYLRDFSKLTQTEFGKLFEASRGMIDSYESGRVVPSLKFMQDVAKHFKLSVEVILTKNLPLNPGYLHKGAPIQSENGTTGELELLKQMNVYLQNQNQEQQRTIEQQHKLIERLTTNKQGSK